VLLLGCSAPANLLSGTITDAVTGAPLAGATVRSGAASVTTDGDGRYELPVAGHLFVERPGFLGVERLRLDAGGDVALYPVDAPDLPPRRHVLLPEAVDVRDEARDLLARLETWPESPTLDELRGWAPRHHDTPQMPETIRVWRRSIDGATDSCQGRIDIIPFDDYVKGVVPHEWIPSWDSKSLEMGAVAARTFAAALVEMGGKYTCADVDDTARSQVYKDDRIAKATAAVDATAGMVVVRDGALVLAEYSAENGDPTKFGVDEPHCTGRELFGHGRGVCQWGTQRWAVNEGKDYVWMTSHYYPGATLAVPSQPPVVGAQELPELMYAGDEALAWVELENAGQAWAGTGMVLLATGEASPFFVEGDWTDRSHPGPPDGEVATGATGRFSFRLRAPEVDVETVYTLRLRLSHGGELFGPEIVATITVRPFAPGASGGCRAVPGGSAGGLWVLSLSLLVLIRARARRAG
jgi:hypothetical protein